MTKIQASHPDSHQLLHLRMNKRAVTTAFSPIVTRMHKTQSALTPRQRRVEEKTVYFLEDNNSSSSFMTGLVKMCVSPWMFHSDSIKQLMVTVLILHCVHCCSGEEMRENRLKKSRIPKPRILQSPALRPKRKECEGRKISQQPHRPLDSRITAETSDYHSATDVSSGSDYTLSSSGSMTSDGEIREWRQHTLSASSGVFVTTMVAMFSHIIIACLNGDKSHSACTHAY